MPVSRIASFTNNTIANATDVSAEFNNLITGINANETAIASVASQTTYTGTKTFSNDVIVDGVLTANGGFLATQGGKPFSYESIPKPVQTPSNLFEIKINGSITATLFNPTAIAVPYFKQFTGSNLTIATTSVGTANGIDVARVSGRMYYLWLIGKDDGTLAGLFSASNTAPTMPTGYTWRRLLPWACATYPPIASYINGSTAVANVTSAGRAGAFIEHEILNWGSNTIVVYTCRFPNAFFGSTDDCVNLVSYDKNYSGAFAIENLACLNVSLSGQPMWLVPPEAESVTLLLAGTNVSTLIVGLETTNGSGSYLPIDAYQAVFFGSLASSLVNDIPIVSRRVRLASNTANHLVAVRGFRCNFTNFWI